MSYFGGRIARFAGLVPILIGLTISSHADGIDDLCPCVKAYADWTMVYASPLKKAANCRVSARKSTGVLRKRGDVFLMR